jgi:hypothetical protein
MTSSGKDDVRVWLKIPAGAHISATILSEQNRFALVYPVGTVAARVESGEGEILDVRGTEIVEGGAERFFVYRPSREGLRGVSWRRGDPEQQALATEKLVGLASGEAAGHVRSHNDCASCHAHARPPNASLDEHGIVNRATDTGGFFQVQTVLEDEAPLETYKPLDPNLDSPFVRVSCGDGPPIVERGPGFLRARCPNGRVPVGHFDVADAALAGDAHALETCEARRALGRLLDGRAARTFERAIAECGPVALSLGAP